VEQEKIYLEITLDKDKRDMAAILVANSYCVAIEVVSNGKGRGKKMLAIWKEGKKSNESVSV
jgi:hypothetical protein